MAPIDKLGSILNNPNSMSAIENFVRRCDDFATRRGVKRSTVSVWIFNDGKRLTQLATGESDVGVNRLAEAERQLASLEQQVAA